MYGVFLALLTSNQIEKSQRKEFMSSILFFIGYNLLYGIRSNSGIDNAAHIGGLIAGMFIGYTMMPSIKQAENSKLKIKTIGILTALLSIACISIYMHTPNDVATYQKEIARFDELDLKSMEAFNTPEESTDEIVLSQLKNVGIYYCKENIKLLDSFQEMNLPDPIKIKNKKLREYCELKIKLFEKMYSGTEEGTNKYEKEIQEYKQKIENILIEVTTNN
jgi:rhomboid protease GluP